ncbi:50S ribosomal protein L3, partial [archaeon]|nr:50S ribosomal protein L3 [archaeon]
KKTDSTLTLVSEVFSKKINKELKIKLSKKESKIPESFDEMRLVVYTQPKLASVGKKKPEIFEILIPKDVEAAKQLLEKEIKLTDVFKEGQFVDVHAVTKGKGFQGTIKRFGLKIRQHKSEKTKRGAGSLGAWHPAKVDFRVPHAGQMGYHTRTEYNKWIIKMGSDPKEINPKGGFLHYGNVKNDYLLIKGSIAGSAKRLIRLVEPIRMNKKPNQAPEIKYINLESKQ